MESTLSYIIAAKMMIITKKSVNFANADNKDDDHLDRSPT